MKTLSFLGMGTLVAILFSACYKGTPRTPLPDNINNVKVFGSYGYALFNWVFGDNPNDSVAISYKDATGTSKTQTFPVNINVGKVIGLEQGTYNFSIRTFNASGDSSNVQTVSTDVFIPYYKYLDTALTITPGLFSATLSYTPPTGFVPERRFEIHYTDTSGNSVILVDSSSLSQVSIPNIKSGNTTVLVKISDEASNGNSIDKSFNLIVSDEINLANYNSGVFYGVTASSEDYDNGHNATNLIDNNPNTYWQSSLRTYDYGSGVVPDYTYPHSIDFILRGNVFVKRLVLQPRIDAENGFTDFTVQIETESGRVEKSFTLKQNHLPQSFDINLTYTGSPLRIKATKGPEFYTNLADVQVMGRPLN